MDESSEKLKEKLLHHQRMVEVLNSVSSQINTSLDLRGILNNVFELLYQYFGFEHTMILLVDPDNPEQLKLQASYGYNDEGTGSVVEFGKGIIGIVAKNKRILRMANIKQRMVYARFISESIETVQLPGIPDCASQLAVPLLTGDELLGVLAVESTDVSQFHKEDESLLKMVGTQIAIAINNAKQYKVIERTNAELQFLNENLESQVKKRTRRVAQQNAELEVINKELKSSLISLKKTQEKLIESEKLASLGQLTAGIAHEIKNPLNFVNNFADLSNELIDEAIEELQGGEKEEAIAILADVKANLKKIHTHGTRADSIVKSMLQHSRGNDGKMEPTDLNNLVREYVNLSFHGMRAGQKPINVDIEMDFDEDIGKVNLNNENFSRVIINLCGNAFDAMRDKLSADTSPSNTYLPKLMARTKLIKAKNVRIEIEDNGPGIPADIINKVLEPFFTTKKGRQGTGLGLSITNDIVKAHGGKLEVKSKPSGTLFSFTIPL